MGTAFCGLRAWLRGAGGAALAVMLTKVFCAAVRGEMAEDGDF